MSFTAKAWLASAREKRYGGQNTAVVTDRVALKNDIAVYVKNIRRNTSSKYRMVLLFNKTNKTHEFHKFYFVKKTLHVSCISFAHHQEFSTVHSASVSFMQIFDDSFQAGSGCSILTLTLLGSCHQTCKKYTNVECTVENSWWQAKEMHETCRVFWQNKICEIRASCWFY